MVEMHHSDEGLFRHWRHDLLSSMVVFLVALPLCMGIALASGAPVATGLVTGIVGGLVVGWLAGAPLQVSGPAAGLTVICAEVIRDYGMPALGVVVLIAGIAQLLAGAFRLGQWFRAVSPAVIHGMLSGIGVLIFVGQLHVMVDDRPRSSGVANIMSLPESVMKGLPLPVWEDKPIRQARIELLDKFSMVHERQGEVERNVERVFTKGGSEELHRREAAELVTYVPVQQSVLDDFNNAAAVYEASPLADDVDGRGTRLREAIVTARTALGDALVTLGQHPLDSAEETELAAYEALADVVAQLKNHDWAAKVGLASIAILILWQVVARGKLRLVPAPLVAVLVATGVAYSLSLPVLYVEVPEDLRNGLTFPAMSVFEDAAPRELLVAGLLMAVIAGAETLLCATAIDRMHNGQRTRYDRELMAQGIGNMICGSVGALPMTGVIVRSAANVQAGAKTRLSAILHGLWLLVLVLFFASFLRMIPTATLAGVLVYTGFKLIDFQGFARLWRENRSEALIFLVTLVMIVVEDLLFGVLTGIVLSACKLLMRFSHLELSLSTSKGMQQGERATLAMAGAATFLRLPMLAAKLEQVPAGAELHVDLTRLDYIDHACLELLTNWERQHRAAGGELVMDWDSLHARFRSGSNLETAAATNGNGHSSQAAGVDSAA